MLESGTDPYSVFIFAMRSPKTREKCVGRLARFFDFVEVPERTIAERCKVFCEKGRNDKSISWAFANILKFLQYQKERFERKEIAAGTVKNYFQAIKLFCDMNDIPVPWKKISKGRQIFLSNDRLFCILVQTKDPCLQTARKSIS